MPCYHPIEGWKSRVPTANGKFGITFKRELSNGQVMTVSCGSCIGCRLERSRQWALRCVHEASLHTENCFITLTYSPQFLPDGQTLVKSDFQKFMKRLRKRFPERRIRDYTLVHIGQFDDETTEITSFDVPRSLGLGVEFLRADDDTDVPELALVKES